MRHAEHRRSTPIHTASSGPTSSSRLSAVTLSVTLGGARTKSLLERPAPSRVEPPQYVESAGGLLQTRRQQDTKTDVGAYAHALDPRAHSAWTAAWIEAAAAVDGGFDILYNNASTPRFGSVEDLPVEDWTS
jgi:hypothetical protein